MEKINSNMTEERKDIKGYEGRYQVSNMGRVKSLERIFLDKRGHRQHIKERILKPSTNQYGYLQVNLYDDSGKIKRFTVHRHGYVWKYVETEEEKSL